MDSTFAVKTEETDLITVSNEQTTSENPLPSEFKSIHGVDSEMQVSLRTGLFSKMCHIEESEYISPVELRKHFEVFPVEKNKRKKKCKICGKLLLDHNFREHFTTSHSDKMNLFSILEIEINLTKKGMKNYLKVI